jgi:hypothetical protein
MNTNTIVIVALIVLIVVYLFKRRSRLSKKL